MIKAVNKSTISETQLHNKCGLIINNIETISDALEYILCYQDCNKFLGNVVCTSYDALMLFEYAFSYALKIIVVHNYAFMF